MKITFLSSLYPKAVRKSFQLLFFTFWAIMGTAVVDEWSNATLQRFYGPTGNYESQLAIGISAKINAVLQHPIPNGNLFLSGNSEVNVANSFFQPLHCQSSF